MKIAICDVCKKQEEFQDECPLKTQEICTDCINGKKDICTDCMNGKKNTKTSIEYLYSPSQTFTRKYLKSPKEGMLVGNTDNIFMNYKTNDLMIVEYKCEDASPYIDKYGQWSIYKEIDKVMNMRGASYKGTFTIWSDKYDLDKASKYKIQGISVTKDQLINFMNLQSSAYTPINFENFETYKSTMSKR